MLLLPINITIRMRMKWVCGGSRLLIGIFWSAEYSLFNVIILHNASIEPIYIDLTDHSGHLFRKSSFFFINQPRLKTNLAPPRFGGNFRAFGSGLRMFVNAARDDRSDSNVSVICHYTEIVAGERSWDLWLTDNHPKVVFWVTSDSELIVLV